MKFLSIASFGMIGVVLRWISNSLLPPPMGTFTVNMIGCFLIGIVSESAFKLPATVRAALIVGFLGGLTTFSSFSIETVRMMQAERYIRAAVYSGASVFLGLLATFVGISVVRSMR